MDEPFKVNVSAINDFSYCEFRWWCKWVMNYVPLEDSEALQFGKLLHEGFEVQAKNNSSMETAIAKSRKEWTDKGLDDNSAFNYAVRLKAIKQLDDLTEALVQWKDQYPVGKVLEIEE